MIFYMLNSNFGGASESEGIRFVLTTTEYILKKWFDIKWNQCVDNEINLAELKFLPGWPTLFEMVISM